MKNAITVLFLTCVAVCQQAKPDAGVYVDQGGRLTKLTSAQFTGARASGAFVKSVYWTFRGHAASVQLNDTRPHFVIYGASGIFPAESIVIVPVEPRKDYRELKVASASMFGGRAGFDAETTVTTTIKKGDNGTLDVLPDKDLKVGEYIITTEVKPPSGQRAAFDFSIQR